MIFEQREVFQPHAHPSLNTFYDDLLMKKGGRRKKSKRASRATQHLHNVIKINIGKQLEEEVKRAKQGQNSSFSSFRLAPPSLSFAAPPSVMRNESYAVPNNLSTNTLAPLRAAGSVPEYQAPRPQNQNDSPTNPAGIVPTPARSTFAPRYGVAASPLVSIPEHVEEKYLTQGMQKPTGRDNYVPPKGAQETPAPSGFFPLQGQQPKDRLKEFAQQKKGDSLAPPSEEEMAAARSAVGSFFPKRAEPGSGGGYRFIEPPIMGIAEVEEMKRGGIRRKSIF